MFSSFRFLPIIVIFVSLYSLNCFAKKQEDSFYLLHYKQGVKLHKDGDLQNSVLYLSNALNINPIDLPTLVELGNVFLELNKPDLATSTFLRAASLAPDDALIHVLLGSAYQKDKQFKESIAQFKQAIRLEPDNVLLRVNLGLACSQLGDHRCAVDNLGKVVLAYPYELRARAALGTAYHSLMDYGLAKEQYKFVLEYEPLNLTLWYNLAKTQLSLGEFEDAKESIDRAILVDDSVVELYLDRAQINYKLNKSEDASNDYLIALKLDPVNPAIPIEYASFLWKTKSYLKAAEQFTKALELEPDDKALLINKAYLLQLAKQDNSAISAWKSVLEKDNLNETALFNLARLYQDKEDYDTAIEYYKKVLSITEKGKDDLEVKFGLAYCLQKNKNLGEAKSLYQDILLKKSDDAITLYNLGILLNEEKNHKEAADCLEKAIKNNFSPLKLPYNALVEAYTKLNDTSNIDSAYKKWLEADKDNVEARITYAKFLAKKGDSQRAVEQYRVAAALDNTSASRYKLAQFLLEQKDLYGAIGQLQEYLKSSLNDLNALILLANAFKDLGIQEQAINTYKKIIDIQSDNQLAYYNLGLLYEQNKKYEDAENYLLKSIELNDKYTPAYYALGLCYILDNKDDKAKELFEKYLQIDPGGEYKEKVEAKLKELLTIPKQLTEEPKT